ncbi:glycosyltransferase family 2 protein [Cellulomonas sp.]|uniref:glycosyltransferase family 2 protein n=1 Tax=Cellulomonas sp. TaxID=40001 RepID=UPI003BAD1AA8
MNSPVHVCIVNYRSAGYLRACVESMLLTAVSSITIVDNASGADERAELHAVSALDPKISLLLNDTNLGFAGGVNRAVQASPAGDDDLIWIVNPDTTVSGDALDRLAQVLDNDTMDIVSPVIFTGSSSNTTIWYAGGWIDYAKGVTWHDEKMPQTDLQSIPTGFITGAAPMMRLRTWRQLDGLREEFFLYWEDVEFSARALSAGLRLGVVPQAKIWHAQGGSVGTSGGGMSAGYYYYGQRNRILVVRPRVGLLTILAGSGFRETARLIVKPALLESAPRLPKLRASIRGIRDGIGGVTGPVVTDGRTTRRGALGRGGNASE